MKLQIVSNLFPLPWAPNRATFNKQQFVALSNKCEVKVLVVVSWIDRLKHWTIKFPIRHFGLSVDYVWFLYIPKLLRITYPATLFLTLIFKLPAVARFRPDCLLLSWAYPDAVSSMVFSILLRVPTIIKIHGSDINIHSNHQLRLRQIIWSMKRANAVISVSQELADKLVSLGIPERKVQVIYNGVDQELFAPGDKETSRKLLDLPIERKLLLFIGNLKNEKGCEDLLEAFVSISTTCPEVDLYFIGNGKSKSNLQQRIENTGLNSRVKLMGSVEHTSLVNWIVASDAIALPSYNEGVPNVLLEAMACGKPVVATNVGGMPEIVTDANGILVELGNMKALAQALEDVLVKPWSESLIIATIKSFTWERNSSQVIGLVEKVIRQHENGLNR